MSSLQDSVFLMAMPIPVVETTSYIISPQPGLGDTHVSGFVEIYIAAARQSR